MDQEKQVRQRLLEAGAITAVWLLVLVLILMGYAYQWTGFREKTLWDWLQLFLAVSVTAIIAYLGQNISRQQYLGQQEAEENRAQAEALEAYLDQIGQLLLDDKRPLRESGEGDEVRTLARAWTLAVLSRLAGDRKGTVVRFLYEARLINDPHAVVELSGVELRGLILSHVLLERARLSGANLSGAKLSYVNLHNADLTNADLSDADLERCELSKARLEGANLSRTNLRGVWMKQVILRGANLTDADLRDANLSGVDLSGANLYKARGWTKEQLRAARFLKDATLPDGQKYEEWLKSKGRGEDGENP